MSGFNYTLSSILRGRWMLQPEWAEAHLPLVLSMLKGNPVSFVDRTGNEGIERPFALDPKTMQRYEWHDGSNPNIPKNSVAVLPISGPITKYSEECGAPGAIKRNSWLMQMANRDHIGSVILLVDTPGGEVRAAPTISNTIRSFPKPLLSYVDGMSASLGMWLISGSDEIHLSSKMDEVGSIGSLMMFADFRGFFEKEGIKIHEVYAPQSTDKNKDFRDAREGDYTAVKRDLGLHVDDFISYIKDTRGDKAAKYAGEWSTGKMFYADDAMRIGLADAVSSFDKVVSKAAWLAQRNN